MAEFDLLIRGGMIVDGTRTPRYRADIGILDGRVAEIGHIEAHRGARVLEADGLIVAPGFVDLHTHYDAQLFWDPYCTLSGWHGITSVAIGNILNISAQVWVPVLEREARDIPPPEPPAPQETTEEE